MTEAVYGVLLKDETRAAAISSGKNFDKVKGKARGADKEIQGLNKGLKGLKGTLGQFAGGLGITVGVAALASQVRAGTRELLQFRKAMAEVSTLLSDLGPMKELTAEVERLSIAYGSDVQEQAKALYQVISAGATNAADAMLVLNQANKLALGGVTDVATAADGLTTILNAWALAASEAVNVSDAMFVAVRAGKTTVDELSTSVSFGASIFAQAGLGFEELLAGTAALTKGGVKTQRAVRGLQQVVASVIKPSAEAAKMAKQLGIQFDVTALKAKGLAAFLKELGEATDGDTSKMAKFFGGVEALAPVLALTGTQAGDFNQILDDMKTKAGETETAVAKMADTQILKLERLEQKWKAFWRSVGAGTLDVLEAVTDAIPEVTSTVGERLALATTGGAAVGAAGGALVGGVGAVPGAAVGAISGFGGQVYNEIADEVLLAARERRAAVFAQAGEEAGAGQEGWRARRARLDLDKRQAAPLQELFQTPQFLKTGDPQSRFDLQALTLAATRRQEQKQNEEAARDALAQVEEDRARGERSAQFGATSDVRGLDLRGGGIRQFGARGGFNLRTGEIRQAGETRGGQQAIESAFGVSQMALGGIAGGLQQTSPAELAKQAQALEFEKELGQLRSQTAIASVQDEGERARKQLGYSQELRQAAAKRAGATKEQLASLKDISDAEQTLLTTQQERASEETRLAQRQATLNTIYQESAGIFTRLVPEVRGFADAATTLLIGGPGAKVQALFQAINGVLDVLGIASDKEEKYQKALLETTRALEAATKAQDRASASALKIFSELGNVSAVEELQATFFNPLRTMFEAIKFSVGGGQVAGVQAFLAQIANLQTTFDKLGRTKFGEQNSQQIKDLFDAVAAATGSPDLINAGNIFLRAELGLGGLAASAKKVAGASDEAARAMRLRFAAEEAQVRTQFAEQFRQAGSDVFEQRRVFLALEQTLKSLSQGQTLALARGGTTTTGGGVAKTIGGGTSGTDDPFAFTPGDLAPTSVAFSDAISFTKSTAADFGASQWDDILNMDALVPGSASTSYVVDWNEAIMFDREPVWKFGVYHWGGVVDISALRSINKPANPDIAYVVGWDEAIILTPITIDDWSDILYFPTLPAMLDPITIGIDGLQEGTRDLLRIHRTTIDDWSDLFRFSALPAPLSDITVGIKGSADNQPGPRDIIRLRTTAIDDWSDLFRFPALPAPLADITVGIIGSGDNPPGPRDMIRLQTTPIDDWSDLFYFPAVPKPLENITVGIYNRTENPEIGPRDMIRLRPAVIDDWSDLFYFPKVPALLSSVNVGITGVSTSDRDMVRLSRKPLNKWTDLFTFDALWSAEKVGISLDTIINITPYAPTPDEASAWMDIPNQIRDIILRGATTISLTDMLTVDATGFNQAVIDAVNEGISDRHIDVPVQSGVGGF